MYIVRLEHYDLSNLITHLTLATERARGVARTVSERSVIYEYAWDRVDDLERLLAAADDADRLDNDGVAKLDSILDNAFAARVGREGR